MINVAVMGYGTVGSGVVELINANSERIARSAGDSVRVKYILDVRDFDNSPYAELFVKDFAVIETEGLGRTDTLLFFFDNNGNRRETDQSNNDEEQCAKC